MKAIIPPEHAAELDAVDALALRLLGHVNDTNAEIVAIHVHRAKSMTVQDPVAVVF